ncbi:LLM class flavin-dependent oxidoreductase [uncultured Corynebacterium sp.]|uniref:LLM class flavin-dependent oxidoreductase n=1 Tax=uncultured Corynebacterium sp. TaxID=159447 RepID=UPI0025E51A48|nr:LLM class flavin-dependent oxidoreductase [uncultured Corynebacterium sp.]
MAITDVQFGLNTFGDVTVDADGNPTHQAQVIRDVVAEGVLADEVGIDYFAVGEHHRADFAVSAPDVVLAGLATVTKNIRLGTAVTVLSSDDPIRVFERFSTIDAMSDGRADIILGRGSFIESFPLFGFDLQQYEQLFSEKLDLFATVLPEEPFSWSGELRPPLKDQEVYPRTENGLTAWIAVGGSPESVVRAARYKMPLMLAVIGGHARRFKPFADLYRQANEQLGNGDLPIGVHSPGFVADTDAEARELLMPHWLDNRNVIGKERGWGPAGPAEFDSEVAHGALAVGSPDTVARKIADATKVLGLKRFDLKYSNGPMPHADLMRCIELYGTEVIPRVRRILEKEA